MNTLACAPPRILAESERVSVKPATIVRFVVALLYLRWGAGVAENFGAPQVSEPAAVALMVGVGLVFLQQMAISARSVLLVAGLLAWVFTGTLSYVANPVSLPAESLALLALLLLYALFANVSFTHLGRVSSLSHLNRFLQTFIIGGSVLSFYQIATDTGFVDAAKIHIQRATGSDVHPVSFAIQMLAALATLECIRAKLGQRKTLLHWVVLVLGVLALYLTFARTAWVMAFVTLAYVVFVRNGWIARATLLAFAIPAALAMLSMTDRFADLGSLSLFWASFSFDSLVFDHRFIDNSVSWRIVNWGYGLQQAMEQPLLGFGPGQSASSSYFNLEMHNIFLETFFEGGVFGLSAFLVVLAGLIKIHCGLICSTSADRYAKALANGFGLSLLAAVVLSTSLVDQLMTVLLYILLLAVGSTPSKSTAAG